MNYTKAKDPITNAKLVPKKELELTVLGSFVIG